MRLPGKNNRSPTRGGTHFANILFPIPSDAHQLNSESVIDEVRVYYSYKWPSFFIMDDAGWIGSKFMKVVQH